MHDEFPGDSWIHLLNSYFEIYFCYKLEYNFFVQNNRGTFVIGDVFISYDR